LQEVQYAFLREPFAVTMSTAMSRKTDETGDTAATAQYVFLIAALTALTRIRVPCPL